MRTVRANHRDYLMKSVLGAIVPSSILQKHDDVLQANQRIFYLLLVDGEREAFKNISEELLREAR